MRTRTRSTAGTRSMAGTRLRFTAAGVAGVSPDADVGAVNIVACRPPPVAVAAAASAACTSVSHAVASEPPSCVHGSRCSYSSREACVVRRARRHVGWWAGHTTHVALTENACCAASAATDEMTDVSMARSWACNTAGSSDGDVRSWTLVKRADKEAARCVAIDAMWCCSVGAGAGVDALAGAEVPPGVHPAANPARVPAIRVHVSCRVVCDRAPLVVKGGWKSARQPV